MLCGRESLFTNVTRAPIGTSISLGLTPKEVIAIVASIGGWLPQSHPERQAGYEQKPRLLYPRPRDFTTGQFRLISTWDGVPTDEDLFRTISRGMPGSAMPSWAHLSEETRWGLVHYVKSFATRPLTINANHEPDTFGSGGAGVMTPPRAREAARSAALFVGCFLPPSPLAPWHAAHSFL